MRRRWVGGGAVIVAAALGALMLPRALSHVGFFRVRKVELVGLQYHDREAVLRALAIAPDRNLFEPSAPVEERARAIPGVVDAAVSRRLPATLRVRFVERVPVAFAPGPAGLVALDADARPLPYDPADGVLDLPVVPRPDSVLVRTLAVVRLAGAGLYDAVQAARRGGGETVILELDQRQVLLRAIPTARDVRAVELVRRHLAETGRPYDELDARYVGWIVARRSRV